MEIIETAKQFFNSIWTMNSDQIATISLAITLLLFILGKHSENRIKVYETRKEEYRKLINFFQQIFISIGKNTSDLVENDELKKSFLDLGASLAIFGSKKLYKAYCFYRRLALDESLHSNRWYSKDMVVYSLGEMYQIMRKEVGLNRDPIPVDVPDILAFSINDFTKPEFKKKIL